MAKPDAEPTLFPGPDPDEQTVACSECGKTFTGPIKGGQKGVQTATMQLGRHRWSAHQIKGDGTRKKATKATEVQDVAAAKHPALASVSAITSEIRGTGTPTAKGLSDAMGTGLSIASVYAASFAIESDKMMANADGAQREAMIDELTLDQAAAQRMFEPLGRILGPTKLNAKYGRNVVDGLDMMPALLELGTFANNWRKYLALRAEGNRMLREYAASGGAPLLSPGVVPPPPSAAPGDVPAFTGPGSPTSGAPVNGAVVQGVDWTKNAPAAIHPEG